MLATLAWRPTEASDERTLAKPVEFLGYQLKAGQHRLIRSWSTAWMQEVGQRMEQLPRACRTIYARLFRVQAVNPC